MTLKNLLKRPYVLSDGDALALSERMRLTFMDNRADFESFDALFDATYAADWRTALDQAMTHVTDDSNVGHMQMLTNAIDQRMDACRLALKDLRYYADLAFEGDDRLAVFGFERASRTRSNPASHAVLMGTMHQLAVHFAPQLTAKGMSPVQIAALQTTATALLTAETDHELYKRMRVLATIERKESYIRMWSFPQRVMRAAEVVYAQVVELRSMFRI